MMTSMVIVRMALRMQPMYYFVDNWAKNDWGTLKKEGPISEQAKACVPDECQFLKSNGHFQ